MEFVSVSTLKRYDVKLSTSLSSSAFCKMIPVASNTLALITSSKVNSIVPVSISIVKFKRFTSAPSGIKLSTRLAESLLTGTTGLPYISVNASSVIAM